MRFQAMREAFQNLNERGNCTSEEANILVAMYKLESAKSREISASMKKVGNKFRFADFVRALRKAKFKYLDSLPNSIEKTLPTEVLAMADRQEDLITVKGDVSTRFQNLNHALLAHDTHRTGLLRKDLLEFMLKLFQIDQFHTRYSFSRCDHNGKKMIAYVEFLDALKNSQHDGKTLYNKTIGPCPRSPFGNIH